MPTFRRSAVPLLIFAFAAGFAAGCRDKPQKPSQALSWKDAIAEDGGVHVKDALGTEFSSNMPTARIVSTAPNVTEILFALGVGDRVVGVTTNCDYPPEAATIEKVGDFNLNYEKIISLKPDLVIGAVGFTEEARETMDQANIPFFAVSHTGFLEILDSMNSLAILLNATAAAEGIRAAFNDAAQRAQARIPPSGRVKVFWAQWNDPLSTVGPGNFHHDLILQAGGENIAADLGAPYGQISEEVVAERAPEAILVPNDETAAWVKSRFPKIPAVVKKRVYVFNSDVSARPGPRLPQALDELSALLYPSK